MPINHLLPFALPRGRVGTTGGRLTVYFSPRLKERARLGRYAAWVDWPATLSGLTLEVRVNGAVVPHTQVGVVASSAVWRAVFSPRTPVAPHRFVDFSGTPLQPMASSDFSERILELYLGMARLHPDGPPAGDDLIALATAAGLNLEPRRRGQQPGRGGRLPGADDRRGGRRRAGRVTRLRLPRLGQPARPPSGAAAPSRAWPSTWRSATCQPTRRRSRSAPASAAARRWRSSWSPGPPRTSWPCPTRTRTTTSRPAASCGWPPRRRSCPSSTRTWPHPGSARPPTRWSARTPACCRRWPPGR